MITTIPFNYEITATQLVARSGVLRWRVALDSIEEVRPSRNPASARTWSLDRLQVQDSNGGSELTLYISPKDKRSFMRDLADAVPGVEMVGEGLARVP